jgi:hypothetical protein
VDQAVDAGFSLDQIGDRLGINNFAARYNSMKAAAVSDRIMGS